MLTRARIWQVSWIACVLSVVAMSSARADDVNFDVSLRGTGSATIHAHVFNNPANRGVTTILAVHGLTETGNTFQPLANAIFADSVLGRAVKRIVSIDLPGHGESGIPTLPSPTRFTDLLIEDNVSVVIQSIDKLKGLGLGAQVIMGHSMGGLAIQAAQEQLLLGGSSLKKKGILGAILIAAVPNRGSVWTQGPASDPTPFIVTNNPALGPYLDLPPAVVAQGAGFRNLMGVVVPNAPTAQQIADNDWSGIEPLSTLVELTGTTPPVIRPNARRGAFAMRNGTLLVVIGFAQDILTPAVDQDDLYKYLTDTNSTTLYRQINTADSVHSMFISNPQGILGAIRNSVF